MALLLVEEGAKFVLLRGDKDFLMSSSVSIRLAISADNENEHLYSPKELVLKDYEANEIFLGRAGGNHIELQDSAISGIHARITRHGNDFILHELGSRNGMHLNGEPVASKDAELLRDGDTIKVVHYTIKVSVHVGINTAEQTAQIVAGLLDELGGISQEEDPPMLHILSGQRSGETFELSYHHNEIKIGRATDCQLVLSDSSMSRYHAEILRDWSSGLTINDLKSRNGVVVNGTRILPGQKVVLKDRDKITLGKSVMIFSDPLVHSLNDMSLEENEPPIQEEEPPPEKKVLAPPPSTPNPMKEEQETTEEEFVEDSGEIPVSSKLPTIDLEDDLKDVLPIADSDELTSTQKTMILVAIGIAFVLLLVVIWMFIS